MKKSTFKVFAVTIFLAITTFFFSCLDKQEDYIEPIPEETYENYKEEILGFWRGTKERYGDMTFEDDRMRYNIRGTNLSWNEYHLEGNILTIRRGGVGDVGGIITSVEIKISNDSLYYYYTPQTPWIYVR